jgi:hypothetical protein
MPENPYPDLGSIPCPFSKHKDELARDIDPRYLRWMIRFIKNHPDESDFSGEPDTLKRHRQWADDMETFLNQ